MSEKKQEVKKRTTQDIQTESTNLQLKAGGIQYTIVQGQKDLNLINERMRDLVTEYHQLKAQEDSEAKIRAEVEAKFKAEDAKDQNPSIEAKQATTQDVSEAAPKLSPVGTDGQSQKQE